MEINRTEIMKELENRGLKVAKQDKMNNGVVFYGICIVEDEKGINPVIYLNDIVREVEECSVKEMADKIIEVYEKAKPVRIRQEDLKDRNYVLNHLFIGLQRKSKEIMIKKDTEFEGIEKYLFIRGDILDNDSNFTVKMKERFLMMNDITEEEAWKYAEENTFRETKVESIREVIKENLKHNLDNAGMPDVYIITNKLNIKGASAILNKNKLKELSKKLGTNTFIMMPSSIHEVLVLAYHGPQEEIWREKAYCSLIVNDSNYRCVDLYERLENQAFIINI